MKYIKFIWALSLFIFLGYSLLAYIYFPDSGVMVMGATETESAMVMSKSNFFYSSMGILLFINIVLAGLGASVLHLPQQLIMVPNKAKWLQTKEAQQQLLESVKGWTKGLATLINGLLLSTLGVIYRTQGHDIEAPKVEYSPMVFSVLIFAWLIAYFFIMKSPKETED
ncbi:hypothetical protein [Flammeovirga sp. SJP92]|uniref:hypothetical protein n=1 Tax=Flammeovirga sp. SJP92 TaxID=1775430 RepID=UPI0007870E45|nr:hypothetical protein [Flammeovirga sp. SJP92]KXX71208.1 hypothetical protein AVL50_09130 [Flammeovirga sp. SJP92]